MSKPIAFLRAATIGSALLGAAVLPAAAADYYGGDDRPLAYHSRDDVFIDGGRARFERRQDLGPADGGRFGPGPVVFDERGAGRGDDRYGDGAPGFRRPVAAERFGFERPADVGPGFEGPSGYGGGYRPVAVGPAYGVGYGEPREGCTVDQARSITAAGWEKTVTHRTCYRR